MTGPIGNLEWSEWKLVISRWIYPRHDIKHHFKWSKAFRGFFRRNCFEGAENIPAIYEVGVRYGWYHHKMHVMYYRACGGANKEKGLILYILSNKFVREEVNIHVKNEFDIYIRRGISRHTDNAKTMGAVKAAADHLKSIDYAWRNPNSRKVGILNFGTLQNILSPLLPNHSHHTHAPPQFSFCTHVFSGYSQLSVSQSRYLFQNY